VPLWLSVTLLKAPLEVPVPPRPKRTVKPPVVRLLPAASLAVRVTVAVVPEAMLAGATETSDCERLAAPGVTVMVGNVEVTALPPIVAVMVVALPAVVPVKVAV